MSDWVGKTLSKVILVKLLGQGGMAEVYLGHHTTLDRPVAVKILHRHLIEEGSSPQRFRREAQAVAALRHPNIVQIFDYDILDDSPYIVMELLDGMPLDEYLQALSEAGQKLPPETIARLVIALAGALDYAHAHNIIHRDIKPSNVILRGESGRIRASVTLPLEVEPVLTDFGVARLVNAARMTLPGGISGTPAYLSPEQARGEPVDGRSDIYSLGVMLYEMLAGRLPFDSPDDTPFSIIIKHITEPPPPVPGLRPGVQAVLDKALAKDREGRYARAGELAVDLMAAIFGSRGAGLEGEPRAPSSLPLDGLLEALELLVSQSRAYEFALPANNFPARAAVSALGELGQQALNEARELVAALEPPPPAPHPLSPRENEVLGLAALGQTNKEIAYRLGISERTIQFHMNSIFNKTGTGSRTEAVTLALTNGWITLPA